MMKIQYMSTLGEAIETHMKLIMALKTTKQNKRIGLFGAFLVFIVVCFLEKDDELWLSIIIASLISCVYILFYLILYKESYRRNIKKVIVESRGTEEAISAEYELTDTQLIYRENRQSICLDLDNITTIEEKDNYIEVRFKNKAIVILWHRIFKNNEEKELWLNLILSNKK